MELHMINMIYAALPMRAQTEKTTFSCKDDCAKLYIYVGAHEAHTALDIFPACCLVRFAAFLHSMQEFSTDIFYIPSAEGNYDFSYIQYIPFT